VGVGKLKQKNFRLYELNQKMLDKMVAVSNERLVEKGYEGLHESEFLRYMIGQFYHEKKDAWGLPDIDKL
jgi:hypothetical protein